MKSLIFLLSIIFSLSAFAGLELGVYEGQTVDGTCLLSVNDISFEGDVKHPLNEKVKVDISFSEASLTLTHKAIIDLDGSSVQAETEKLSTAIGLENGAEAVILEMNHGGDNPGPTQYFWVFENYKTKEKVQKKCFNLRKV